MRLRAFTLIELLAVIVIVAMVAAIAMPKVTATIRSERQRGFLAGLERIAMTAQQQAQSRQTTIVLNVQDNGLVAQTTSTQNQDGQVVSRLAGVEGMSFSKFQVRDQEVGDGDWLARFYPDGTADSAGIQIDGNGSQWRFVIDAKTGRGRVEGGELSVIEPEKWPVGDYAPR